MRLKHCPECDIYPKVEYMRDFLFQTARVYCPKCGKTTEWYSNVWSSTASDAAKTAWNEIITQGE